MRAFTQVVGVLVFFFTSQSAAGQGSEQNVATSLHFLLGEWEALPQPGQGSGYFSFIPELGGRVVVRKNHAEYPASQGRPAVVHDDIMTIYREGNPGRCRAIYIDTEGHVIHYVAEIAADSRVTFLSEGAGTEPRYRLSYARLPDGTLAGKFESAAPGKPDTFVTYFEWTAKLRNGSGAH